MIIENRTYYTDLEKKFEEFYEEIEMELEGVSVQQLLDEVTIDIIYVKKTYRSKYYWTGTYYRNGRKTIPPQHIRIRLNRDREFYEGEYPDIPSAFFYALGHELYHHLEREHLDKKVVSHKTADELGQEFREFYRESLG